PVHGDDVRVPLDEAFTVNGFHGRYCVPIAHLRTGSVRGPRARGVFARKAEGAVPFERPGHWGRGGEDPRTIRPYGPRVAIILIGTAEHLSAFRERDDFKDAQTFSDTEALRALETITRKRPDVVSLERAFASTTRGAALINRIKADPKLSSCEIRIVAQDTESSRVPPSAPVPAADGSAVAVAAPAPAAAPLDQRGPRRAPRVRIADGIE